MPGPSYNYSYDSMYRLGGMTDSYSNTIVSGVLNQLTNLYDSSGVNLTYNYPTGTNNRKVGSMYNAVSGETVTYTYDSLNRMATANGSGWGEAYTFDPFGNLTTKHVTSGSGPSLSQAVNQANNQIVGQTYDANGNAYVANAAYDVENHVYALVGGLQTCYSYDGQGKRIFMWTGTLDGYNNPTEYSVVSYSASGQKLGTYELIPGTYYSGGNYVPFIASVVGVERSIFRRAAAGGDGSVGIGGDVLSVGRGEGRDESARHLELRDVLAGFGDRAGLRQ